MNKEDIKNLVVQLVMVAKRNETGWERHFSDSEVAQLRKIWNDGLPEYDADYWR